MRREQELNNYPKEGENILSIFDNNTTITEGEIEVKRIEESNKPPTIREMLEYLYDMPLHCIPRVLIGLVGMCFYSCETIVRTFALIPCGIILLLLFLVNGVWSLGQKLIRRKSTRTFKERFYKQYNRTHVFVYPVSYAGGYILLLILTYSYRDSIFNSAIFTWILVGFLIFIVLLIFIVHWREGMLEDLSHKSDDPNKPYLPNQPHDSEAIQCGSHEDEDGRTTWTW
ncbi:MAG: hypothetical protein LBJ67_11470 [Planctomycetaceae bacterium]|jgi:hypothetical protein|nr:hypothetical protein [Planctomycetaceae bacterium]